MARTGTFKFGLEVVAHQMMQGRVLDPLTPFIPQPLLDLTIAREALAIRETRLQRLISFITQLSLATVGATLATDK